MANPLDNYVSKVQGKFEIHLPPVPKLSEHVKANGFKDGLAQFDSQMEAWRQNIERVLQQTIRELETKP